MPINLNQVVPEFKLIISDEHRISSTDLRGKNVVLYFYPKDNTPGCTVEGKDFARLYPEFQQADTEVFGISRDNFKSHTKFKCQYDLPFDLASDQDGTLCTLFDVLWPKNMFGKIVNGISRSTFLIDKNGILRQEWRKVIVAGHAAEVLAIVKGW
ncbi:MAG TPA: peroxiredoxin [Gammaproteobacteria bacterium]|nr:peroxiredoxin [Gammaproteobacteria bacterium]